MSLLPSFCCYFFSLRFRWSVFFLLSVVVGRPSPAQKAQQLDAEADSEKSIGKIMRSQAGCDQLEKAWYQRSGRVPDGEKNGIRKLGEIG